MKNTIRYVAFTSVECLTVFFLLKMCNVTEHFFFLYIIISSLLIGSIERVINEFK